MLKRVLWITICFLIVIMTASCVNKTGTGMDKSPDTIDHAGDDKSKKSEDLFSLPATLIAHGVIHERIGEGNLAAYAVLREPRICNSSIDYSDYCTLAEKTLPQDLKKEFPYIPDTWFKNHNLIILFPEEAIDVKGIETRLDNDGCLWIFLTVTSKDKWLDGYTERTRLLTTLLFPWDKAAEDDDTVRSLEVRLRSMWDEQTIVEAMNKL